MHIDLLKEELTPEEIFFVNKYIGKIFKQFFMLNGYKADRNSATKGCINFFYEYNSPALTFFGYKTLPHEAPLQFMPMRYYDYPNTDDDFAFNTWAPNQGWILGFVERLLSSLSKSMLKIIDYDEEEFLRILDNDKNRSKLLVQNSVAPNESNKHIVSIQEKNSKKTFTPCYFNFERFSNKEIREDIKRLILK